MLQSLKATRSIIEKKILTEQQWCEVAALFGTVSDVE